MVVLAMVLALSVGGTASGEDMPAGTSTAETAVKSAGKTGEITFPVGSYIVDMGDTFSDDAQLKPYGLIYDLVLNAKVPVYWVINGSKTSQTGVDLTYNGRNYISGPFVISGVQRQVDAVQVARLRRVHRRAHRHRRHRR